MELLFENWYTRFLEELSKTRELKIISPFVNEDMLKTIQCQFDFNNFELITRFNLQDFAMTVSSLSGLRFSIEMGASIYGIKGLHSKVYLFDNRAAIVTSANLSNGGLVSNYECGIFLKDTRPIQALHAYFNKLKKIASNNKLTLENCESWEKELNGIEIFKGKTNAFQDYGASDISFNKKMVILPDQGLQTKIKKISDGKSILIDTLNFLIGTGKYTRKQLIQMCIEKHPDYAKSTITTYLTDCKNPKYNPLRNLVKIVENDKMQFISD